jgi:hypothetical protein
MRHLSFPFSTIAPCLPKPANEPPIGSGLVHEIKHDGFRILVRYAGGRVRLYTRNSYDFADRFPRIVEAIKSLPVPSCFIDGEAIVINERGLSAFDLLRSCRHDHAAVLCAFDLIELNGKDLRSATLENRESVLAKLSTTPVTSSYWELKSIGGACLAAFGRAASIFSRIPLASFGSGSRLEYLSAAGSRLVLYAGNNLDKARRIFERTTKHRSRIRLTIRQRMCVLDEWPRHETLL